MKAPTIISNLSNLERGHRRKDDLSNAISVCKKFEAPGRMTRTDTNILIFVTGGFRKQESGSHARFSDLIDFCASRFNYVYVYVNHIGNPWTNAGKERFKTRFPTAKLVLEYQTRLMRYLTRAKNIALTLLPALAKHILAQKIPGATPQLERLFFEHNIEAILVNFVDGTIALNGVDISRVVIETHDVKFMRHNKLRGSSLFRFSIFLRFRSEMAVLSSAKGIVAISAAESGFYKTVLSSTPSFFVSKYVRNPCNFDENLIECRHGDVDILFFGSNMIFNIVGLVNWLRHSRDWLKNRCIAIAGTACGDPVLQQLARDWPTLELHGFVADINSLYARSKIVIAPIDGTGLKIKVVEALQSGKPVFASKHARDALPPGCEECVFPMDPQQMEKLLDDPLSRAEAGRAALRFIDSRAMQGDAEDLALFLRNAGG